MKNSDHSKNLSITTYTGKRLEENQKNKGEKMGNLLDALIDLGNGNTIEDELLMCGGFVCPYCLENCSTQRGHESCRREMKEEKNNEFDSWGLMEN